MNLGFSDGRNILGYKGHVCEKCLSWHIKVIHDDEEILVLGYRLTVGAATNVTSTLPTTATIGGLASGGLIPFGGSALVDYIIGFALKKIIKWLLIGLAVLAGIILIAVQWMANNGYIQGIRWDKLGNSDIANSDSNKNYE
jgi:uncharacterized membrane protein (Fun14 family)